MSALADPPALAPPRLASVDSTPPPGTRFVLEGVNWATYVRLADAPGNDRFKFTFDEPTGRLEIEMPNGFLHESASATLALLVSTFAREFGIRTKASGSLSLRRRRRGGADADESFYISSFDRLPAPRTNLLDLERDLPPDLVIEVDVTSPGVAKLPIYARLGVKEVWVWAEGALACHRLNDAGEYETASDSGELPGFPLAFAAELLRERPDAADGELQDALIERLRADRAGAAG
ncbi:Uma2 family endonuclease [Alienimonas sp. DA493]|uniref:Uma2 family endonuclease n=1 Tax=Alienimonas sp. DA493 TaxID=3373605 RepID=UPI00375502BE